MKTFKFDSLERSMGRASELRYAQEQLQRASGGEPSGTIADVYASLSKRLKDLEAHSGEAMRYETLLRWWTDLPEKEQQSKAGDLARQAIEALGGVLDRIRTY